MSERVSTFRPEPKIKTPEQVVEERLAAIQPSPAKEIRILIDVLEMRHTGTLDATFRRDIEAMLAEMIEKTSLEKVWDALILHGAQEKDLLYVAQNRQPVGADQQAWFHEHILDKEDGYDPESPSYTFGYHLPSYRQMLEPKRDQLAQQSTLHALLLGGMTRQTGDEFSSFIHSLNPNATPVALDKEVEELQYSQRPSLRVLKADATALPLQPVSQDLVFTNNLMDFLIEDGIQSGKAITEMLAQAASVLKPGGSLVMVEDNPCHTTTNATSWAVISLLAITLKRYGFAQVSDSLVRNYEDHVAKIDDDQEKVSEQVYEHPLTNEPAEFSIGLIATKARPEAPAA